jgi:hypothetical protein
MERWPVHDRDEWLARRRANVNASEVGALFGAHPYITLLELYCDKANIAERDGPTDGVLYRGQIFEPAVAEAVAKDRPDWKISKATDYLVDPDNRIGATPDYIVECPNRGRGVLQTKTVGTLPAQIAHWGVEAAECWAEEATPPLWVQLQTLQEMLLEDVQWGAVGALLLDPNNPRIAIQTFDRHADAEARLLNGVGKFWAGVRDGVMPNVDYARDAHVINALYPADDGSEIDLSGDNYLPPLLARRKQLVDLRGPVEKELSTINTEIAAKMGAATTARLDGWKLTRKLQHRKPTPASSFRVLRVREIAADSKEQK